MLFLSGVKVHVLEESTQYQWIVCYIEDTPVSEVTMKLGRHKIVKKIHPLYPYRYESKNSEPSVFNMIGIKGNRDPYSYAMVFDMIAPKDANENSTKGMCMTRQNKDGKYIINYFTSQRKMLIDKSI